MPDITENFWKDKWNIWFSIISTALASRKLTLNLIILILLL